MTRGELIEKGVDALMKQWATNTRESMDAWLEISKKLRKQGVYDRVVEEAFDRFQNPPDCLLTVEVP